MHVAFRVDSSERIGTGHLMRCLTLADAIRSTGATTRFICRHLNTAQAEMLVGRGHEVRILPAGSVTPTAKSTYQEWLGTTQAADADDTISALDDLARWDWLVVDHYALDQDWETRLRSKAENSLVIDDLANRKHQCDLFLDQNLQPSSEDRYKELVPREAKKIVGPQFALLRPEFREARENRAGNPDASRLNICFGGTDPDGATVLATEALNSAALRELPVDIVIGTANPHRARIASLAEKLPNTTLHIQPPRLAALMSRAQLALGAGGATSWERCCMALPTAIVSLADNQKNGCSALMRKRAAIYVGDIVHLTADHIAQTLQGMLAKPILLRAMSQRAATLVDGKGTERVVEAMACI